MDDGCGYFLSQKPTLSYQFDEVGAQHPKGKTNGNRDRVRVDLIQHGRFLFPLHVAGASVEVVSVNHDDVQPAITD